MADIEKTFAALPHVTEVWVTKDGNFHLHPNNGGEKKSRIDFIPIEAESVAPKEDEGSVKKGKAKEKKSDVKSEE